ncbi:MAG: MTH1187 family thiamine-binding protein [Spirochaetes bacterium]|nr:MTH1187 family thiamine-binding protein [Spirochaetota bacterium]
MAIMEISIIPIGTKSASVSSYVAEAVKVLNKEKNVIYELTSMGTIIQSDSVKHLLMIAEKMHAEILKKGVDRIVTSIKIDDRKDKNITMNGKIKSLEKKLRGKI